VGYLFLAGAIGSEVLATSLLHRTAGFTRPGWTLVCLAAYGVAFFLLAHVVKTVPVGVAYAVWSGVGTAAVVLIGATFFGQVPTAPTVLGVALIVGGVLLVNLAGGAR
jgi:small multidrug resistance pump